MIDFAAVKQQPLSQTLLVTLREAIISGRLKPGEPLVQSRLATQFGVSRAPLREALHRLEEEGFVKTVPYKGTGPAMNDLLGGQVDIMCDQTTNTIGQIKAGKIKVYGVTTKTRVPSLPDVPTMSEAGLPGFEVTVWHGLYAPKGTPKPVIDKLVKALQVALKDPNVKQRFAELGTEPVPENLATPEALRAHLKAEIEKWGPILKKAGVYAD